MLPRMLGFVLGLGAALALAPTASAAPYAPGVSPPSTNHVSAHSRPMPSLTVAKTAVPVAFPCGGGATCRGELWLPEHDAGTPPPVVVLGHGFALRYGDSLTTYATRFVQEGMAALLFDYRGFGASSGTPREVVDGYQHVLDFLSAVRFVKTRGDVVDPSRIGLFGTSYSGGHVLIAAAKLRTDRSLRAVVSQVPFVDGISSAFALHRSLLPQAVGYAAMDLAGSLLRQVVYLPVVNDRGFAAFNNPEDWDGYRDLMRVGTAFPNRVAARVFASLPLYRPTDWVHLIRTPVLMMAGERDTLIPVRGPRAAAARNRTFITYEELRGATHWDPYALPLFTEAAARQAAFLRERLRP